MTISGLKLHYVVADYGGFGGPIRMLLDDAGVDYEYNYIPFHEEFLTKVRYQWVESGHPFDCAPMIELDGKRYGASQPIIRFLSKKLGKYIPTDDLDAEQFVDATTDYAMDWARTVFRAKYVGGEEGLEEYKKTELDKFFTRFNRIFGVHEGPYALGQEISYCDFYVYIVMSTGPNKEFIDKYPNMAALAEAIRARPNLKEALKHF
ncbi:hypothetical protein O0I10_001451 [Lichtheimia ornata]|uniref:Glutathione s-transferase n=1 Tax=Lichtheimia ornata TaxID=688661 RepID=A0AAD7VCB5_9FUNG|nr:uncharacterized protein O0I10_001451 [Lichtheimia ornata]KAJ8662491.1 hypothetical protein O0I10_001451 [Lichtheimia ornata]